MLLKEIPPALVEAFIDRRLVAYAGAGLSVGSGLPTGRDLAIQLQTELFRNNFVNVRPSPSDLYPLDIVAQRYQVAFGRQRMNDVLLKTFQKDGLRPNEGHRLTVRLFSRIITTNFDRLLEDAVQEAGRYAIVVIRDLQIPNTSIPDRTIVYKLHGDIATPERIVITQRDFSRIPLTEGIQTELRSILLKSSVLFLGYGLSDPDFLSQIEFCRRILGQEIPKSYAVMPGADNDPLFVKQCDQDNIDLFSETAADFLDDLEKAARSYVAEAPKQTILAEEIGFSEAETNYKATICEDFRWIDFKGIPVLGGYLRVRIDQIFVSLSAAPQLDPQPELAAGMRKPERYPQEPKEIKGIFDILKNNKKLAILGDPGSGKTTFLRYIGYHLSLPQPQPEKIGLEKPYLPVFIPLREYAAFLKLNARKDLAAFMPHLLRQHNLEQYLGVVESALKRGDAILLFDGLDEVASEEERTEVAGQVQEFSARCADCRLILTSRKVGYPRAPVKDGTTHYIVEPLNDQDIQAFVDLWCKATDMEGEKQSLIEAISNPRVRALAESPLLITILGRVYKAYRNLPERRAELYAKCVEALLTTWDLMRDLPPVFRDTREANRILGPLALWIHRDCGGQFVTKEQLIGKLTQIGNLPGGQDPSVVVTQIEERSGLLRQVGLNQYAFTHMTFQEYYAAREIVSTGNCFRQLRRFLRNDRWQEVIILTAGLLDSLGAKALTEFLESFLVLPTFPSKPTPLQAAKLNLLLACFADKVEPEHYVEDYVQENLLSIAEAEVIFDLSWLPRINGFGRTRIGAHVLDKIRTHMKTQRNATVIRNYVVVGYNSSKGIVEKLEFFMVALTQVEPVIRFLTNVAVAMSGQLSPVLDTEFGRQMVKQIKAMPLERRLKIIEPLSTMNVNEGLVRKTVEIWTSPEERTTLPESLRKKS